MPCSITAWDQLLQDIRRNAAGDTLRRLMDRVARQMGVARRRLYVAVAEQLADHRQGLAERQCAGREAVTEVMQPDILQPGPAVIRRVCWTLIGG